MLHGEPPQAAGLHDRSYSMNRYSTTALPHAGRSLARHHRQPYEQAVRERILGPLGMDSTAIVLSEAQRAPAGPGHDSGGVPVGNWDMPTLAGAGAWRSSACDMLALVRGNLELEPGALAATMRLTHVQRGATAEGEGIALGWHI
jgi:CubicO group peptidase (beta-lactamase class C family)